MKANEFTRKVNKLILERGKDLYEKGCVNYSEALLDSICLTVNVNGYLQIVCLETDNENNEILNISCGCPYFQENHFCKHTVAALYYYCNMIGVTPDEKENNCLAIDNNGNILGNPKDINFHKYIPNETKLGFIENCESSKNN